jgi:hypothetical protein
MPFSIIIPSRTASNLIPCIRAIREAGETARIIVVDDFERRGDCRDAIQQCYGCTVGALGYIAETVNGDRPFIFARNANIGIRAAGEDDVILLNDDALLKTPMGFSGLRECFESPTPWGIMAATCNNVGNANQWPRPGKERREEDRMVCFVAVYIPRSTINAVGLLDERFVGYGLDDDDYCLRVRNAGLKIGIFDGCYVDHGSLQSSFRGEAGAGGNFHPNMKLFIDKWGVDNRGNSREQSPFRALFPTP